MILDIFFPTNLILKIEMDTEFMGYQKSSYDKSSFWPYQRLR